MRSRALNLLTFGLALALLGCQLSPATSPLSGASDRPLSAVVSQPGAPAAADPAMPLSVVGGTEVPADTYAPHQLVLDVASDVDARQVARAASGSVDAEVRFTGRYVRVRLPGDISLAAAARTLGDQQGVRAVSVDWRVSPSYLAANATPNDPRFADQWAHRATHAVEGWRQLGTDFTAANTAIAILDTGCDVGHPEFAGRVLPGTNFSTEHPDLSVALADDLTDLLGHGTHVTGIAAAAGNDGQGVAGVAWDAKILPVKVLRRDGGSLFDTMRGIHFAADYVSTTGAVVRVINMSLGAEGNFATDAALADALMYAWRKGIVMVTAAGNSSGDVTDPGSNPDAVVVSSTSHYQVGDYVTEFLSGFSNRGDRIDVAAPGGEILSTLPRNSNDISTAKGLKTRAVGDNTSAIDPPYGSISGTSMAAPYVSGLAALLAARYDPFNLDLTASFTDRAAARLRASADDLGAPGRDPLYGYGRVNVLRALTPATL